MTKWAQDWAIQRSVLILWSPVLIGIGAAFYFGLGHEPSYFLTGVIFVVLSVAMIAFLVWRKITTDPNRFDLAFLFLAAAFWISAGFTASVARTDLIKGPMLTKETRPIDITGRIIHREMLEEGAGYLLIIEPSTLDDWPPEKIPRRIRLSVRLKNTTPPNLGDTVTVLAKLHPPSRPVMPGAMDFQRFYFFQKIGAIGFALKPPIVNEQDADTLPVEHMRQDISEKIHSMVEPRSGAIVSALMTGERAAIAEDDWLALRASGLAHIISISGLHVVMVATPIFFMVRLFLAAIPFLALHYPIKKFAAFAALIGCLLYISLIVPSVPSTRAMMMTGIMLVAIMLDRSPISMRLICFTAAVILLLSPESIWGASFQMSFAAVTLLIAFAEWSKPYWTRVSSDAGNIRKIMLYVAASIMTTVIATIATSPFSSFHFQQIALYGVIANALAIPLTGIVIMPMVIFAFLLMPFGVEEPALKLMAWGVDVMLDIAHAVANLPGAMIVTPIWPMSALIGFVLAGLLLVLNTGRFRALALIPFTAACVLVFIPVRPDIIVSESGKQMLVRTDEGVMLASKRAEQFTADQWIQRLAVPEDQVKYFPREGREGDIACDAGACRIQRRETKIAFGTDLYTLNAECSWANIIVTPQVMKTRSIKSTECKSIVMDKFFLMDHGAVSIILPDTFYSVREDQGNRPWSTWPSYHEGQSQKQE